MRVHRLIIVMLGIALLCLAGCADEGSDEQAAPPATEATTTTQPPTTTTEAVDPMVMATELADAWIAGWAKGDPQAVAAVFTEDGVYAENDYQRYEGREAIAGDAAGAKPKDPQRTSDLVLAEDGRYVFQAKYGWAENTYAGPVELVLDGDHAAFIGWKERKGYRGHYEHLFEAEYAGTGEIVEGDFCDEGLLPVEVAVIGSEAGLGPFEGTGRHCSDPETGVISNGEVVIVVDNGDELHGAYEGRVLREKDDGTLVMQLVQTYQGGTGRFADAVGEVIEPCTARYVSETEAEVAGELVGTVTYDAS